MTDKPRIAVCEPDPQLCAAVVVYLAAHGFDPVPVYDLSEVPTGTQLVIAEPGDEPVRDFLDRFAEDVDPGTYLLIMSRRPDLLHGAVRKASCICITKPCHLEEIEESVSLLLMRDWRDGAIGYVTNVKWQ